MTVLKILKKNALVSIALGALVITSFGTGNAEALFDKTRKAMSNVGHKINCKAQCNRVVVRGNKKKLDECASSCDVATIKDLLIADCKKLNDENKGKLQQVLNFEEATLKKDQRVIEIEMEHLQKLEAGLTKSMISKRQKQMKELDKKQTKLITAINNLAGKMNQCELTMAKQESVASMEEAEAQVAAHEMAIEPAKEIASPLSPPPLTSPPPLPTETLHTSKLPTIPVKSEPKVEAEVEEQPEPGSLAAQLRAQKLKMEEKPENKPQGGKAAFLGGLGANPMAGLKRVEKKDINDKSAPVLDPTAKKTDTGGTDLTSILQRKLDERNSALSHGGDKKDMPAQLSAKDKITLDKLLNEGKTPEQIKEMSDDDFDLFEDFDLVEKELKKKS